MQSASALKAVPSFVPAPRQHIAPSQPFYMAALRIQAPHILTGAELSHAELHALLELARLLKGQRAEGRSRNLLQGQQLALLFEKPSLRTRVSFTVGMQELGGNAIEINSSNTKHEEPEDTARVLAGFTHGIMARVMEHDTLERMASVSPVPIINGLSDLHHPCQIFADLLTLLETYGSLEGLELAYIGDGNNILHSLLLIAPLAGVKVRFACPKGYGPNAQILATARLKYPKLVQVCKTPAEAVKGANAVYTDVWTSMGFEAEAAVRDQAFAGYQLNEALYSQVAAGALILHCLPMVRGKEISQTLPEHPCSAIFRQSENRLHAQKALLLGMLPKGL
jgi:ornithine carbamoyltransferase